MNILNYFRALERTRQGDEWWLWEYVRFSMRA